MAKKQAVSPAASGGAGTLFEYRVAAIMLTHLLRGTHPPGLLLPVLGIGLQQRVRGRNQSGPVLICGVSVLVPGL